MTENKTSEQAEKPRRGRPPKPRADGAAPPASSIAGAATPEELASLAGEAERAARELGVKVPKGESASTVRKMRELVAEAAIRRQAEEEIADLMEVITPAPFEVCAIILRDQRWINRLTEDRLRRINKAAARAAAAWGVDFSGRWTSLTLLAMAYSRAIGTIATEIMMEDAERAQLEAAAVSK